MFASKSLDGAIYGLFETNGQKVKEVTLKKSGDKVTGSFENMQIMHDYYVQEIKAPEGYNLDSTKSQSTTRFATRRVCRLSNCLKCTRDSSCRLYS